MPRKIVKTKYFFEEDYRETIAEVSTDKYKDWGNNDTLNVVGKAVSRIDGYDKVSGTAIYTFDVDLPGMTHARILGSAYPNAKIKKINTKKAKQLDGVLEILTFENAAKIPWFNNSTMLFDSHVRYEGDEVAAIVAESDSIAEEALKLIEVEYEQLSFVTSSQDALKVNSVKIHDNGNIVGGKPAEYDRGNIEEGFKEADYVLEDKFETQIAVHNSTEVHCSVVNWDGNKLKVWDSTQGVFAVRNVVSRSLGLPESDVTVITKYMGGGFGSKLETGKYTIIAALLARDIGKPVKITVNRKQMNLITGNRPDSIQTLKAGIKKDGTLTAMSLTSYSAVGAYPSWGGCSGPIKGIYKCSNLKTTEYSVMINAGRARAFRAPGHVQGTFALESFIDELAEKAGIDPLEFRLKNYSEVDPGSGSPYTTKLLREAYKKGSEAIGWYEKRKPTGTDTGYLKRGIGMATQIWGGSGGPPAYVTLKLNSDGSVTILGGSQDIGTGTYTILAQVVSEVLEIPIDRMQVILGNTSSVPFGPESGGSTTAPSLSPAARDAAEQMKSKIISGAAAVLGLPEDELVYKEASVYVKNDKSKSVSIPALMHSMHEQMFITNGARSANPEHYAINSFGAHFAEVEVNTETGKIKVLKIVAAHDIGRVLNQKTVENQFHGGIIQGIGFALMEERILDANTGKVLNTDLHTYKIPTIKDVPEIEIYVVSKGDNLLSNTGVKGMGEPAIIPTAGAIANAVYNAIGKRIKSLPMTPDKVLNALYG